MLRRTAWATWPPPIEKPSPSPPATRTSRSGLRQLDPLRDRQGAAVDAVEAVGRRVARDAARAPDARDEGDLVGRPPHARQGPVDRLDDTEVPAARTPDGLEVALVVLRLELLDGAREGAHGRLLPQPAGSTSATRCRCRPRTIFWSRSTIDVGRIGFEPLFASGCIPAGTFTYIRRIR